jgi:hypothetical protein
MKALPALLVTPLFLLAACNQAEDTDAGGKPPPNPGQEAADSTPDRVALAGELGELMAAFGSAVSGVSDRPSWDQARIEIRRINARITEITGQLASLPEPSPEQRRSFSLAMKENEDQLEKALGSKEDFISKLPEDVGRELMETAGEFSRTMGSAQHALYGSPPP